MPLKEAQSTLDVHYLPPARQGDLLSAVHNHRPKVIGLVDGEFSQALSVWHKEILFALEEGIQVYGAASMGALRAAETEVFGMVGIGEIFAMYRDGVLRDDDEVALQYAPASDGYRNLSMPMVNIRATLEQAQVEGRIDRKELDFAIKLAKSLFFRNRAVQSLRQRMLETGLDEASSARICDALESHYVDLKRADTHKLLQALASIPTGRPARLDWELNRSAHFRMMMNQDRKVQNSGIDVSMGQIARCSALHDPDFNEHNFNARNRVLTLLLAEVLKLRVDENEISVEAKRFRTREQLTDGESLNSWLKQNDLDERMFRDLMEEIATCRKLHRWLAAHEPDAVSTKALLDELRLRGLYPTAAARAASLVDLADSIHPDMGNNKGEESFADLVACHLERTDWALEAGCKEWAEEAGFRDLAQLRKELLRARSARRRVGQMARKVADEIFSTTLGVREDQIANEGDQAGREGDQAAGEGTQVAGFGDGQKFT
jgi:hypothetical protein